VVVAAFVAVILPAGIARADVIDQGIELIQSGGCTGAQAAGLVSTDFAALCDPSSYLALTVGAGGGGATLLGGAAARATGSSTFTEMEALKLAERSTVTGAGRSICVQTRVCIGILAIGAALLAFGTRDVWLPWVEEHLPGWLGGTGATGDLPIVGFPLTHGCYSLAINAAKANSSEGGYVDYTVTTQANPPFPNCGTAVRGGYSCATTTGAVYSSPTQDALVFGGIGNEATGTTSGRWYPCGQAGNASNPLCQAPSGYGTCTGELIGQSVHLENDPYGVIGNYVGGEFVQPGDTIHATVNCKRPDGSTYEVTDDSLLSDPGLHVRSCDPGDTATGLDINSTRGGVTTPQAHYDLTPQAAPQTIKDTYPLCFVAGATCGFAVKLDNDVCEVGIRCAHWTALRQSAPGRLGCYYGPYTVAIDYCSFLERAYEPSFTSDPEPQPLPTPQRIPATAPNTDGKPDTWSNPGPNPAPNPGPEPSPSPSTTPNPNPSTTPNPNPSTTPNPNPSTGPSPGIGTNPDPFGSQPDPDSGGNCWAAAISWNPVDWVETPVKCALQWAFVPTPQAMSGLAGRAGAAWNGTAPGQWTTAVAGLGPSLQVPSASCQGPPLDFTGYGGVHSTYYLFNACNPPVSNLATGAKIGLGVLVGVAGALACVRTLGGAFGLGGSS
jgi:hypothetical protein